MLKYSVARSMAVGFLTISSLVQGQIVRGTVIDSTRVFPARGVVVTAIDSSGRERSRILVDSVGRFRLILGPGTWHLRARQIGYRMQESPSFVLRQGEERILELSAPNRPIALPAVQIVETKTCVVDPHSVSTLDVLWEQVEASVHVAGAVAEDAAASARWVKYEQMSASEDTSRRLVHIEYVAGALRRVFTAVNERVLAKEGFVTQAADGVIVRAPDADLLLTPWFRATHCFRVTKTGKTGRGRIGLSFAPIRHSGNKIDVTGTLWFATASLALQQIDFEYIGLPVATIGPAPGGSVVFGELPDSTLFVRAWEIAFPKSFESTQRAESPELDRGRVSVLSQPQKTVKSWHYEGGAVYAWTRGAKTLFSDERRRLLIAVKGVDSLTKYTAKRMGLADLPPQTVHSSDTITYGFVPNGLLGVVLEQRLFNKNWHTDTISVELGDDRSLLLVEYPSIAVEVSRRCKHQRAGDRNFDLLLSLENAGGSTLAKKEIRVDWQDSFQIQRNGRTVSAHDHVVATRTDERGFAVACELPRDTKLRLTLIDRDRAGNQWYVRADTSETIVIKRLTHSFSPR